ncbi:MAG: hypothetical protein NTY74_09455 [Ignavibacteriae bacterium]|nr:hypothetical protein [Ignavibacteriota bacterium]
MKTIKIVLVLIGIVTLSITFSSCENAVINNTQNTHDNFQLLAWDYSESHYFLDTLYRRSFTEVYNDSVTSYVSENTISTGNKDVEVWVQCNVTESYKRLCVGWLMLGERPVSGYDTSFINTEPVFGEKFSGYFKILDTSQYYINPQAGFIGLKINVPENYYAGVVYKTLSNKIYGQGRNLSGSNDTLILKLFKIDTPDPLTTPVAWNLKMKNVYRLPYGNILRASSINLMFYSIDYYGNNFYEMIPGYSVPLITMLKLDRFNNSSLRPPPDGKFDWIESKIIYTESGDIVFPVLEPFGKGLKEAGVDSTYWFGEIYTKKKILAQMEPNGIRYWLKGNAVY